jgi:Uma2 family endonuclease
MVLQIGAHGVVLTYDDYRELPDDGQRYEIIEGVLHVSPAPSIRHQFTAMALSATLYMHCRHRRLGRIFSAPCDVVFAAISVVQPDIIFVSQERLSLLTDANVQGAPDLVVEVISPSSVTRDLDTKRQLYAQYGVKYYWLVHPIDRWVRAYELRGSEYELVAEAEGDQPFSAPPFPDLAIDLTELWSD